MSIMENVVTEHAYTIQSKSGGVVVAHVFNLGVRDPRTHTDYYECNPKAAHILEQLLIDRKLAVKDLMRSGADVIKKRTAIGIVFRSLREKHEVTLSDMATRLNMSTAHLSSIEFGRKVIAKQLQDRVAKYFELTEEELESMIDEE